jgi:tape measure domain-containing protein
VAQKEVHIRISASDQASGQFRHLQATVKATTSAMQDLKSAMSRALSVTAGLGGFYAIKGMLVDSTKEAFRFKGALEQTEVGFRAMTGSAQVAKDVMSALRDMSLKVPIELETAQDAARRLLAYGFRAGEIVPILKTIADAAAGLGLSMQDGGMRIALALGQIKSKGTLQAQEMRQLGEAGIAAWKMLADYLNISVQEAMDRVQKRMIDSQTATTAILAGMQRQFAGQMEAQATTFHGRLTVMASSFKQAMAEAISAPFVVLRDEIMPGVTEKLQLFARVAHVSSLSTAVKVLVDSFEGLQSVLGVVKVALEAMIFRMGAAGLVAALTAATTALNQFKMGLYGVEAVTAASKLGRFVLLLQTVYLSSLTGAGGLAKLKAAAEALNFAILALGRNLYWIIPLLATVASQKIFGRATGTVESLDERRGMGLRAAPPLEGQYGDDLAKKQAALREDARQEYLRQDRLFIQQAQANQELMDEIASSPIGKTSSAGGDKYSKFVQNIKEQARQLRLEYELGRISIDEYAAALDRLAATPGLKDVHRLDITQQKWEAYEPIWKQYQEIIDKEEQAREDSRKRGIELIRQWNETEIELERLKAQSKLEIQAEYDQAALDRGEITKEELIRRKIAHEEEMYRIELEALQKRLALGGLEVTERDNINKQIEQLQLDHNLKMVQLELQLQQQRKTALSVTMQEYASTQANLSSMLAEIPARLADAFASAAVGYGNLSDMLKKLAQDIAYCAIKAMLLRAILGISGGAGGIFGGASLGGVMGGFFHSGGIVGKEGVNRFVSLLPRFHSGGLSGDEQLAVLQKGEGVFTKEQMKAMGGDTTIVNMTIKAIDAKSVRDFFTENRGIVEGLVVQNLRRNSSVRVALQRG